MQSLDCLRRIQSILAEGNLLAGHPEQARRRLALLLDRGTDQETGVTMLLPLLAGLAICQRLGEQIYAGPRTASSDVSVSEPRLLLEMPCVEADDTP